MKISDCRIGLGCWQLGDDCWGDVGDEQAGEILREALNAGVTFFDTADVYGGGLSERRLGGFIKDLPASATAKIKIATKIGRFPNPGWPGNFEKSTLRNHILASSERLGVEVLDLVQLHCIPTSVLVQGEVFDALRDFQQEGLIRSWGVSVESVEEGLLCLTQPGISSLQVIFNVFRQKPARVLLPRAEQLGVSIIVRLPLASGLLTGKYTRDTKFPDNDHRNWNQEGNAFHVGETFNGIPFLKGLELVDHLKDLLPEGYSLADAALRWILDHSAVTVIIPGASRAGQASRNMKALELMPLPAETHKVIEDFYAELVAPHIRGNN